MVAEAVHCPLTQLALGQVQRGEASVVIMDPTPEMEPGNIVITSDDTHAAYDGTSEAALAQVWWTFIIWGADVELGLHEHILKWPITGCFSPQKAALTMLIILTIPMHFNHMFAP
jgi:hypothetical protein